MEIVTSFAARRRACAAIVIAAFASCGAPATGADQLVMFQSPSGNAHCLIDTQSASEPFAACELREFTGRPPPKPSDCELDWVPGASVDGQGRVAVFACQGDTIQSSDSPKLDYGKSIRAGAITCSSATTGITCRHDSGRGFLVSRAVIRRL